MTKPDDRDRPGRQRRRIIIAVAAVAALAAGAAVVLSNVPGSADDPANFRPLAGAGSDTTGPVLAALSEKILDFTSYDVRPRGSITTKASSVNSRCGLERPTNDELAVKALASAQQEARRAGGVACLDFARSTVDTSAAADLAGAGLTFVPFAVDAVTFAQRSDSTNPRSLTPAGLAAIFTCSAPKQSDYKPLLPAAGSGLRRSFLSAIGVADSADFTATHSCVSEVSGDDQMENHGRALTDPRQIAPYSVATYVAQTSGAVPDGHGIAVLGQVGGVAPTIRNTKSSAVGIVRRADSIGSRTPTSQQLAALYSCSAAPIAQRQFRPLLPQPGSALRASFLQSIGLTDSPDFTTAHPCVSQTAGNGQPVTENNGTLLTDPRNIAPYSVEQYLAQVNRAVDDVHGNTVLGQVDGATTLILNTDFPLAHAVYNVVPTDKLAQPPTSTVFVGPTSAICKATATITANGFAASPKCGDTTIHTPS